MPSSVWRASSESLPGAPQSSSAFSGHSVPPSSSRTRPYSPSSPRRVTDGSRGPHSGSSSGSSCSAALWDRSPPEASRPPSERSGILKPPDRSIFSACSHSPGSSTCSRYASASAIRAALRSPGSPASDSSQQRFRDRQEPRHNADGDSENRRQHAREEREFFAPEVDEHEEQKREKTGPRSDQDDDPSQSNAILPNQVAAGENSESPEGRNPDENVRQHDQERTIPEEVFEEREEPVHGTYPCVAAHDEQNSCDGRQEGSLVIRAHDVTALGGSSGEPRGFPGGPRSTSARE